MGIVDPWASSGLFYAKASEAVEALPITSAPTVPPVGTHDPDEVGERLSPDGALDDELRKALEG